MLSKIDNETVCRVGPGTPMGELLRQYWLPALLSALSCRAPDSDPVRVMLLGEELIAFRDTNGTVGLIGDACPHRGATLFFGRNEECGLRCVYHGWKFDAAGNCVDMPNEPAESDFQTQGQGHRLPHAGAQRARSGPTWARANAASRCRTSRPTTCPRASTPSAPSSASATTCRGSRATSTPATSASCTSAPPAPSQREPGTFQYYALKDRAPRYQVVDTDFGCMYSAYRPAETDTVYHRIALFLFPFWTHDPDRRARPPGGRPRLGAHGRRAHDVLLTDAEGARLRTRGRAGHGAPSQHQRLVRPIPHGVRQHQRLPHRPPVATQRWRLHRYRWHPHPGSGRDRDDGRDLRPHEGAPGQL